MQAQAFSPFDFVFGHQVRGPLDILHNFWTDSKLIDRPVLEWVEEMRNKMEQMQELAIQN